MARGGRSRLLSELRQLPAHDNPLRRLWGLDGKFVVGYSGNLGRAHEFDTMLAEFRSLRPNSAGNPTSKLSEISSRAIFPRQRFLMTFLAARDEILKLRPRSERPSMRTYRGVELEVVENTERRSWTWTARIEDPKTARSGFYRSRLDAMFAAEHAIDRILARETNTALTKLK